MAKSVKKRYFVLGAKASIFFDPASGLKVTSKTKPAVLERPITKRISLALDNKHINEVDSAQVVEETSQEDSKETSLALTAEALNSLSNDELVKAHKAADFVSFYKENYEVDENDLKTFEKMTKSEMVDFLKDEGEDE